MMGSVMDKKELTVQVHGLKNFTDQEKVKFKDAVRLLHKVINSEDFKKRFLNLKLVETTGKTNIQIFKELFSGKDKFNTVSDHDVDVYATMYYSFKRTVGYTYPDTWKTWINRKYFSNPADIAGNIIHEYMHNLGYGHSSPRQKMSVPYAAGDLVRDMINEMSGSKNKSEKKCKRLWYFLWLKKSCN